MDMQILGYDHTKFKAILAIDFDLTICMSEYPELGEERKNAGHVIRRLMTENYGIVINTCRTNMPLAAAIEWLEEKAIPYHYVNCNFPHLIELYGADCRKVSADLYIDDKGITDLPEWDEIYEIINDKYGK